MSDSKGYYAILEVASNATDHDIRKAYRHKAKLYHPDSTNMPNKSEAQRLFIKVSEAYETLSDPDKRRRYDYMTNDMNNDMNHDMFRTRFGNNGDYNDMFRMHREMFNDISNVFQKYDTFYKNMFNMSNVFSQNSGNNYSNFSSVQRSETSKVVNGETVRIIREKVNDNGKISETITTIDKNGKKTTQLLNSNSDKKQLK